MSDEVFAEVELYDQVVDWSRVDALLADISMAAELLEVLIKGAPGAYASGGAADLAAAATALRSGASGVQLRYRHDGIEWWDTLMPVGAGNVRIVRTRPPVLD